MQNVLQVLIRFFRKVTAADHASQGGEKKLLAELDQFGVSLSELEKTLSKVAQWVDQQTRTEELQYPLQTQRGTRIYSPDEIRRISKKSLGFIIKMEQLGILTPSLRECILDQLMQLAEGEAVLSRTKWITFQTLFQGAPPVHVAYLEWLLFGTIVDAH